MPKMGGSGYGTGRRRLATTENKERTEQKDFRTVTYVLNQSVTYVLTAPAPLHSPFSILHSPFSILHSPFSILHSPFSILHSPFSIPNFSAFRIPNSAFRIFCSPFSIFNSQLSSVIVCASGEVTELRTTISPTGRVMFTLNTACGCRTITLGAHCHER